MQEGLACDGRVLGRVDMHANAHAKQVVQHLYCDDADQHVSGQRGLMIDKRADD